MKKKPLSPTLNSASQSQNDQYHAAITSARIGIWDWQVQSGATTYNSCWANLIGYELEELQPVSINTWQSHCHPDDLERANQLLDQHFKKETAYFEDEFRMRHKAGHWVWIHARGSVSKWDENDRPVRMSGTHVDITELQKSRENLKYRIQIERLVTDISSDFVGIPVEGVDLMIDHALAKIGHFANIDRCYVFQVDHPKQLLNNTHEWCSDGVSTQIDNLQAMPVSSCPWWMIQLQKFETIYVKDISDMPPEASHEKAILESQDIISLLVVPIHYNNQLLGFMGFDSVAEKKAWLESDIHLLKTVGHIFANAIHSKHTQESLIRAMERSEESNRLKSAFLATMSHELRTPLHHILGFSELLKTNSPNEESERYASIIHSSGSNLLEIVEDVFSLALAEQSEINIRKDTFRGIDLYMQHKALLEEILESSAKQSKIELHFLPGMDFLDQYLIADKSKITQVLLNLLKNAVKYTSTGRITYKVQRSTANELLFSVSDTGIGIPANKQQIIFEFFRQADDSHTRTFGGIGIGLAISQRIANILGGNITLESKPGEGSTFHFRVPVDATKSINRTEQQKPKPSPVPDLSGKCLLVAEDDPISLNLIKKILKPTHARLLVAENGKTALEHLQQTPTVDLVLMDIKMPVMDGHTATRSIRLSHPNIPVIALTAHALYSEKKKALQAGCESVITKPINRNILFSILQKQLL